jgi:hypothetical protein
MITRRLTMAALAAVCLVGAAGAALAAETSGTWTGALEIPNSGPKLRLRLQLTGADSGTVTSIDQGNASIPVKVNAFSSDSVDFEATAVGGHYTGKMSGQDRVEGTWTQGGGSLPLAWIRGEGGIAQ